MRSLSPGPFALAGASEHSSRSGLSHEWDGVGVVLLIWLWPRSLPASRNPAAWRQSTLAYVDMYDIRMDNLNDKQLRLAQELLQLTPSQQGWVAAVIAQFKLPHRFTGNPQSDLITPGVLEGIGDALRIHHAFSRQALSKDRFEFALERVMNQNGAQAFLANSRTNRGHDITINGHTFSLKTEAASNIKADSLHISKFMELGRGEWQLPLLRDLFLEHMRNYERVLQFRCLGQGPEQYVYELVEIPKALLEAGRNARLELRDDSRQNPKPGYGYVFDSNGQQAYALYFDGGTERKLQIKGIRKDLCVVHATWSFQSAALA